MASRVRARPEEIDLAGSLEAGVAWRIEVSQGMRAPIVNGQPTLRSCWRADCSVKTDRRWNFLVTIVDDTIEGLFHQLHMLSQEGPMKLPKSS